MAEKLHLKIADRRAPAYLGNPQRLIPIEGVDANFIKVIPQIGAFRRMVREVEFDVCELAPTTYIIARAYGAPFVALPIFVIRRFHHAGCWFVLMLASRAPRISKARRWAFAPIW